MSTVSRITIQAESTEPVWRADLAIGLYRPISDGGGNDPKVVARNAALRLLVQRSIASDLTYRVYDDQDRPKRQYETVKFLQPLLMQAALHPGPARQKLYLGGRNQQIVAVADPDVPNFPPGGYAELRLKPAEAWPEKKDSVEIQLPRFALDQSALTVGLPDGRITKLLNVSGWNAGNTVALFGKGGFTSKLARSVGGAPVIIARLVPDGVEFDVTIPNPFRRAASLRRKRGQRIGPGSFDLRVRLFSVPEPGKPGDPQYRLRLVGGPGAVAFRLAFDEVLAGLRNNRAELSVDIAPGIAPVEWAVRSKPFDCDPDTLLVDPAQVNAVLTTERGVGGALPATATLALDFAELKRDSTGDSMTLTITRGKQPTRSIALQLDAPAAGPSTIQLGTRAQSTKFAPFRATADTQKLRQILTERYDAARVREPTQYGPLYAFVPLERGMLQVPLPQDPPPTKPYDLNKAVPAVDIDAKPAAFSGLIRLRAAEAGSAAMVVELTQALHLRATLTLDHASNTTDANVSLSDVRGQATGVLWAYESSPSPTEILPTLEDGPAALRPVPLAIGVEGVRGWEAEVAVLQSGKRLEWLAIDRLTDQAFTPRPGEDRAQAPKAYAVGWLAHPKLALAAAMGMTRSAASATRPSTARDLVPHAWELADRQTLPPLKLRFTATNVLPTFDLPSQAPQPLAWPWPDISAAPEPDEGPLAPGVSLVSVTLPGIEFAGPRGDKPFLFGDLQALLRFDLPILGELFAGAALKRGPKLNGLAAGGTAASPRETPTALDLDALPAVWAHAAERLSLTRTMLDRVTPWIGQAKSARSPRRWSSSGQAWEAKDVKVAGLLEPYVWKVPKVRVTTDVAMPGGQALPLGAYALDGDEAFGSTALKGLRATFKLQGRELKPDKTGPIEVVGFAAKMRREQDRLIDTRGFGLELQPDPAANGIQWRASQVEGGAERRHATIAPVDVVLGDVRLAFAARDLPLTRSKQQDPWLFEANAIDATSPEAMIGPDGALFQRAVLANSVYEWRLYAPHPPQIGIEPMPPAFSIPLGPLGFRPLRLWKLELAGPDNNPAITALEVLGSISPPREYVDTSDKELEPFGDDAAYASGNLFVLGFTVSGNVLDLASVEKAAVKPDTGEIDVGRAEGAPIVRFASPAVVHYGPSSLASSGAPEVAVTLSFRLGVDRRAVKLSNGKLEASLFGRALALNGTVAFESDGGRMCWPYGALVATFEPPTAIRDDALGLIVRRVKLEWSACTQGRPAVRVLAEVMLAPSPAETATPRLVRLRLGEDIKWLGVTLKLDPHTAQVDHDTGTITATVSGDASKQALLRGFRLPDGMRLTGTIALALDDAVGASDWPGGQFSAGFAEFLCQPDGQTNQPLIVRHALASERVGKLSWGSRLVLTLPVASSKSAIAWPVGSVTVDPAPGSSIFSPNPNGTENPLPDDWFAPDPDTAQQWHVDIKVTNRGTSLTHTVTPYIEAAELPAELLGMESGDLVLRAPWRFIAVVKHVLQDAAAQNSLELEWESLDQVAVFDLRSLVEDARRELDQQAKGRTYVFAGRYRNVDAPGTESPRAIVPTAGIVRRAFARAGFPGLEVACALAMASEPVDKMGLVLTGAGLLDIALRSAGNHGRAERGVTLPLPWIAARNETGSIAPLERISQRPDVAPAVDCRLALYDLAAFLLRAFDGAGAVELAVGSGSVPQASALLDTLFGKDVLRPVIVVDQAFASRATDVEAERRRPPKAPAEGWFGRPIFWRSLFALKRLWLEFERGKAGKEQFRRVFARRVATVLTNESTEPGGNVRRTQRVVVRSSATEAVPKSASPVAELLVLSREKVFVLPVSQSDATAASREGSARARVARLAFARTAEPLAVVLATVDEPDPRRRDATRALPAEVDGTWRAATARLHGVWQSIDRPAVLDLPAAGAQLRCRDDTLFASPALGWPVAPETLGLGTRALGTDVDQPIQDEQNAWVGRARNFSSAAFAWKGSDHGEEFRDLPFVAFGRKVLFRRPEGQKITAPPSRALTPVPPRARAPLPAAVANAVRDQRMAPSEQVRLDPILPGRYEAAVTGIRPGVMVFEHDGLVLASAALRFDPSFDRFGRAADRGPVVWRQVRSPRSTALPKGVLKLDRRRRTFVAEDEREPPFSDNSDYRPFKLVRGPAAVLRYDYTAVDPAGQETLCAITLRVQSPTLGRIGANWDGVVELIANLPQGVSASPNLTQRLARLGLLNEGCAAELVIGARRARFASLDYQAGKLTFRVHAPDHQNALLALADANAETSIALVIHFAPADVNIQVAASPISLRVSPTTGLQPGPPRVVTIPLPLVPVDRPFVPVEIATLAFGDPAYDRDLASPAKSDMQRVGADTVYLLALDRTEYDVRETIHFAVGKVNAALGRTPEFDTENPDPWSIAFAVQPKARPNDPTPKERPLRIEGVETEPNSNPPTYKVLRRLPYAVAISALREADGAAARLESGDRLVVTATGSYYDANGTPVLTRLRVDVGLVDEPVIAPPAAVYSLVTLDNNKQTATTALFATAPLPQLIEYPNLLADLARGHVRRRALFVWRYVPRDLPTADRMDYATLVKFDRTGGGQLPDGASDFRPMEQ